MFLVAEIEGAVVGYASWRNDELMSLFVHPDWQGRGVGTQLIQECLREAESKGSPIAHVNSVLGAEPFYARFGFQATGADKDVKQGIEIPYTKMARQS